MSSEEFACCSKYNACSNKMECVNPENKNVCLYWKYNLSQGRAFWGPNAVDNIKREDGYKKLIITTKVAKKQKESNLQISFL